MMARRTIPTREQLEVAALQLEEMAQQLRGTDPAQVWQFDVVRNSTYRDDVARDPEVTADELVIRLEWLGKRPVEKWQSYVDVDGTCVMQAANAPITAAALLEQRGLHEAQIVRTADGTDCYLIAELVGEAWRLADCAARRDLLPRIQTVPSSAPATQGAAGYDAAGYARELVEVISERLAGEEDRLAPVGDALGELERLLALDGLHPDAALRAREAISCLAAVWLTDDERDERAMRWMR